MNSRNEQSMQFNRQQKEFSVYLPCCVRGHFDTQRSKPPPHKGGRDPPAKPGPPVAELMLSRRWNASEESGRSDPFTPPNPSLQELPFVHMKARYTTAAVRHSSTSAKQDDYKMPHTRDTSQPPEDPEPQQSPMPRTHGYGTPMLGRKCGATVERDAKEGSLFN